jgi:glutaredoxin-like protein NrdH
MSKVTVYSKTGFCGQCMATERALLNAGVEFEEALLEDVPAAQIEAWKSEVGMTAPIVVTDTDAGSWSGFRPDKIAALRAAGQ